MKKVPAIFKKIKLCKKLYSRKLITKKIKDTNPEAARF